MERELGLDRAYISALARSASHKYKSYRIKKKDGGERIICHPSKELKALQRWLARRIIIPFLPTHEAASAYRQGSSIAKNARSHVTSRYLLRVDFVEFFPSISAGDISLHLQEYAPRISTDWARPDTELFVQLVCRGSRITIGAVTSPSLSNCVCFHLDESLFQLCQEREVTYTRYADDLFFSAKRPNILGQLPNAIREILRSLPYPRALKVNRGKTYHSSMRNRRSVTGVVLSTNGKLSMGRAMKRRLRSMVYRFDDLDANQRKWLRGYLAHAISIEPDFLNRLYVKYDPQLVDRARGIR